MVESEEMKGLLEYLKSAPGVRNIQYLSAEDASRLFNREGVKEQPPVVRKALVRFENMQKFKKGM